MNVGEVLETVEQSLLSRELSSLERFILCHSWLGRSYSEMASDCAYSIAHIKDIGSQLWQALSKVLRERVTKKNLFLVLKQYLLSRTGEIAVSDQLSDKGRYHLALIENLMQPQHLAIAPSEAEENELELSQFELVVTAPATPATANELKLQLSMLPEPDENKWKKVRSHLASEYSLPLELPEKAKDVFHEVVKIALQKDGLQITHYPYTLQTGTLELYIDLSAEKVVAAEQDGQKIESSRILKIF